MIFKFISLLVILNSLNSLKSNYFCLLSQNESLICKNYQCSLDTCSKDKESCDQLKNLFNNNQKNFRFFDRIKTLSKISSDTKICKKSESLSFKEHACLLKNKCDWTKQIILSQLLKTTLIGCNCPNKLKFYCGNNYCSVNKYTCNSIFNTKKNNESHLKLIKYC